MAYFGPLANHVNPDRPTNDVDIIFTSGLYLNNPDTARLPLLQQEGEWRRSFLKRLRLHGAITDNGVPIIQEAFYMGGWDENITAHWKEFSDNLEKLKRAYARDGNFKNFIHNEIKEMGRQPTPQNVAFIFEETAVTALWLEGRVTSAPRIRTQDKLNAIHLVYPGDLPGFMGAGLDIIFKNRKGVLPLHWIDTSNHESIRFSEYRFGKDAPTIACV